MWNRNPACFTQECGPDFWFAYCCHILRKEVLKYKARSIGAKIERAELKGWANLITLVACYKIQHPVLEIHWMRDDACKWGKNALSFSIGAESTGVILTGPSSVITQPNLID